MWIKLFIIFVAGIVETYMFTGWSLAANKKQVYLSSFLMLIYMIVYLMILDAAFKDNNSKLMIVTYAISCGIGNFIRVSYEKRKK
jgi:uncharacterized protein YebE (UPF0316 family)